MDYFATAVSLARQEGAKTLTQVAMKSLALKSAKNRTQETCYCSSFDFPHRAGSGSCPGSDPSRAEIDRQELECFDRAEARAINGGRV